MRNAVLDIESAMPYGAKYALLDHICSLLSELDGKYEGCRYSIRETLAKRTLLRQEHSVPRRVRIGMLLGQPLPSKTDGQRIFDVGVGAVVTVDEDRALNAARLRARRPTEWDGQDIFPRYRAAGVELVDTWHSLADRPVPLPHARQSP